MKRGIVFKALVPKERVRTTSNNGAKLPPGFRLMDLAEKVKEKKLK